MARKKTKPEDDGLFALKHDGSGLPLDEGRVKALDAALNDITKRYGDGTVMRLGDASHMTIDTIPTGSLTLDIALGVGGLPRGRMTEIYGPESSGKTTLCLHVVSEAQKRGGLAAFIDMEHALDPTYAARIGVDLNRLYISQPDTGEQAMEIVETLVRSGALDVIVIDSVAALVPRAEIEGEMGDSHVGLQARLMSQALRKLSGAIKHSNVAVLFTNQIREKVGIVYGCFSYQAPVLLADGTTRDIGYIVNNQEPVEVLTFNSTTGCFEPKKVINWFKNGIEVDKFNLSDNQIGELKEEFITLVAYYPDGTGYTKVSSTANHEIATPYGYVQAGDIDLGDEILALHDEVVFSKDLYQLILGSMLGDGSIRRSGHHTSYFREEHAPAQAEYVDWKHSMFGDLAREIHSSEGRYGFETVPLSAFGRLKSFFYRQNGRYKTINEAALRQLTPFSLAVWYQDDGALQDDDGKRRRNSIYFHTTDQETRDMVVRVLHEVFGLSVKVHATKTSSVISFSGDEATKFEALIAPYVHPSMAYKLRNQDGIGSKLSELQMGYTTEQVALTCEVYEIRRKLRKGKEAVRYNLQVEDNANYLVGNVLVHNSPETQPGGRALKFYASVRLDIRRVQAIKVGGETVGNRTKVRVTKNKVSAPFRESEFDIMFYEGGISKTGEIVDLGVDLGIIEKRGAFFRYNDGLLGQGRENAKVFLRENPAVADEIEYQIRANNQLATMLVTGAGEAETDDTAAALDE
jgi:recombination protein RecA